MHLVDIVLPVYNSVDLLKKCVNSLLLNTNHPSFRILIIDDGSDDVTKEYLLELSSNPLIDLITNSHNVGYLHSVNKALMLRKTTYKVLVNSDIIVPFNWLQRLINPSESDETIGMVCPLSNFGSSLTIKMPQGLNFITMDKLIHSNSKRLYPNACTVIGFCILITQKLIDSIGIFDPYYSPGYYEECDYQYVAYKKGFKSVICDDLYIYHRGRGSFGGSREVILQKNRAKFHKRWDHIYIPDANNYSQTNSLGYLRSRKDQSLIINYDHNYEIAVVITESELQSNNGILATINNLIINGTNITLLILTKVPVTEYLCFEPIIITETNIEELKISTKKIIYSQVSSDIISKLANDYTEIVQVSSIESLVTNRIQDLIIIDSTPSNIMNTHVF